MRSSRWSSPAHSAPDRARRSTALLAVALFAVYALTLATHASPGRRLTAPAAHVLMTAQSLADDGDLDLRDQYARRAWRDYYGGTLHPTAAPDRAGRILEPQGVGFPLLLAPAYAVGGVLGVRLLLAALAAAAFACAAALGRRLVPDPWATGAALVLGLSPPVVAAATAIRPEVAAAAALAGAAVLALRIRDEPAAAPAFWAALLVAMVPWLALSAALPAAVVALALARWMRRRRRGWAGFVALEVVLMSAVVYITIDDRLYGGLTPYAGRLQAGPATGLHDAGDVIGRLPRIAVLCWDLLRWAPVTALVLLTAYGLLRAHRSRLAAAVAGHVHVEVAALLAALVVVAQLAESALAAPRLHGAWFPTRMSLVALPFAAALAAWSLRHHPRVAAVLGGATVALTVWMLVAALAGDATLAPPRGFGL